MNSTETKTEVARDWQIFREANSDGQWSEWRLNTSSKNLLAHDYRECAHVRRFAPLVDSSIRELHEQLTKQNDTLRTRLEAVEKANVELVELVQRAMLNTRNDAILLGRLGLGDSEHIKETQWWKDAEKATAEALKGEG